MSKKYRSPIILDEQIEPIDKAKKSYRGAFNDIRNMKDEIASSFVYGDESYEEEYVVPDVIQEVTAEESPVEESGE